MDSVKQVLAARVSRLAALKAPNIRTPRFIAQLEFTIKIYHEIGPLGKHLYAVWATNLLFLRGELRLPAAETIYDILKRNPASQTPS
jgi:hypothetical protein